MEFSFRISQAQFLAAWKLNSKRGATFRVVKRILFWVFILICLCLLWGVVERSSQHPRSESPEQTAPIDATQATESSTPSDEAPPGQSGTDSQVARANRGHDLLVNVGPFAFLICFWLFLAFGFLPIVLRRNYRKSPAMQGEFTVDITPQSISIRNTAGTSYQSGWNVYEYWREGKDLIILKYISGGFSILNLAGLSGSQRDELRGILATALRRR